MTYVVVDRIDGHMVQLYKGTNLQQAERVAFEAGGVALHLPSVVVPGETGK